MIVPNPRFRPNPARAIYVDGITDESLLSRLTPAILRLQSNNRDPITVYIVSSPGGPVAHMQSLLRLLKSSDQDSSSPCDLITVVTQRAASAAADLLSSGDYALAFPDSTILYHGIRFRETLTAETTSMFADILRAGNDAYAMELARKIEMRFLFRFMLSRNDFENVRNQHHPKELSDLECFLEIVSGQLSEKAKKAFEKAKQRYGRYESLLRSVIKKEKVNAAVPQRPAEIEAKRLKAIVDFEVSTNRKNPNWTFKDDGLNRLADDFFLLNEYLESQQNPRFQHWCKGLGRMTLSKEEQEEIALISDEKAQSERIIDKVRPALEPVWSFFVALCHALQEGENELTATDAYWLGLVDEVVGASLPTSRWWEEYQPDPTPEAQQLDLPGAVVPDPADPT